MLKEPRRVPGTTSPSQPQIPLQVIGSPCSSPVAIPPILCVSVWSANVVKNEAQPSDLEAGLSELVGPSTPVVATIEVRTILHSVYAADP